MIGIERPGTELTAILVNFARSAQLHDIIDCIRRQSIETTIWVWNNDVENEFKDDRADWVVQSSCNIHGRCVPMMYQMAKTQFVVTMDDDLYPSDDDVFADAVMLLKKLPNFRTLVGAYGVRIYEGESYSNSHHIQIPKGHGQLLDNGLPSPKPVNFPVDLLKGRIIFGNQKVARYFSCDIPHWHTDLYLSMMAAGYKRWQHIAAGLFWDRCDLKDADNCKPRIVDFPIDDLGYVNKEGHMAKRDELCSDWVMWCPPDPRVTVHPKYQKAVADS